MIDRLKALLSSDDLSAFKKHIQDYLALYSDEYINLGDLAGVLGEALRHDKAAFVSELLEVGMRINDTHIAEAITFKAKKSLSLFFQKEWDINKPICATIPPILKYAIQDEEMALWLIEHGADLNKQTSIDITPLSYAAELSSPSVLEKLLDHADVRKGAVLQHAINRQSDNIEILTLLLDRGAPINAMKHENHAGSLMMFPFMGLGPPLHTAASMGRLDVVRFLIEGGADKTIKDRKGRTARDDAERLGHPEVAEFLDRV